MKKRLVIAVVILTTLMNIFSFLHINKNLVNKLLFDKTIISFNFDTKDKVESKTKFLNKIIDFSEKNDVEIAQYSFLSANKIDIYSTMKDKYREALFVPNLIFNRDIKVHNFEEILDVGLKNLFYIDTKDKGIIKELSNDLIKYGKLYDLGSTFKGHESLFYKFINYIDVDFLPIFTLFIFVLLVIILFYYLNSKKDYLIYELWGYTYIQIYSILNKSLYRTLFVTIILSNLVMSGFIYKFILSNVLFEIVFIMIILNMVIVLLLFLFSIILFLLSFANLNNNNRKKRFSDIILVSCLSKFLLLLLIIFLFKNFSNQRLELNDNLNSLVLWENTENLFNIHETYSPFYHGDLASEDILNDKILKVYKDLSDLDKVFIINSINFERSGKGNINGRNEEVEYDYNYKINVKNEDDLYSPHGRNILVDKNYLKRNIIRALDGKNVLDKIDYDEDVLNILVAQELKDYEITIENSYKEWFYFQKVYVNNMYREASNKSKIEKNIDELRINIIYIEKNQSYFTYNKNSGDSFNTVIDPIVTIYTENVDNSFLASTVGSSMFLESKDEYSALKELNDITQKYNVNELNAISSVYDKKGQEIKYIEDRINRLMMNIIVAFLLLIMLMTAITYAYYKSFLPTIVIKSLFGYSFMNIYKDLLLINLYIYTSTLFLIAIIYKRILTHMIIVIGLMLIIDYIIIRIINMVLFTKGEIQFIKGELK